MWKDGKCEDPTLPDLGRAERSLDLVIMVKMEMDKHSSGNFCRRNSLWQGFITGGRRGVK